MGPSVSEVQQEVKANLYLGTSRIVLLFRFVDCTHITEARHLF